MFLQVRENILNSEFPNVYKIFIVIEIIPVITIYLTMYVLVPYHAFIPIKHPVYSRTKIII